MPTYETYSTSLTHYGIKGQKWGVRRFQNEDGSYTDAGKKRYRTTYGTNARGESYTEVSNLHRATSSQKRRLEKRLDEREKPDFNKRNGGDFLPEEQAAGKFHENYKKHGESYAISELSKAMGNTPYKFLITKESTAPGEEYLSYRLDLIGDKTISTSLYYDSMGYGEGWRESKQKQS